MAPVLVGKVGSLKIIILGIITQLEPLPMKSSLNKSLPETAI